MIQWLHFEVHIGDLYTDEAADKMVSYMDRLAQRFPAFRGAQLDTSDPQVLKLALRCSGRDRWWIIRTAKPLVVSILRRAGLDKVGQIVLVRIDPPESARSLTKEQGRNVTTPSSSASSV